MRIVTDCAVGMPGEELQALGILQAPLFINFPEGEVNSADISADEFYDRLEAMRPAIPSTSQPSSELFQIKPVIRVDHQDGKYSTAGKGRTIAQNLGLIVNHIAAMYGSIPLWATVLHGRLMAGAQALSQVMSERLAIRKMEILHISPVLGVNTGPGIVGAAVLPAELVEDLS